MRTPEWLELSLKAVTILLVTATATVVIALRPERQDNAENSSKIELKSATETTLTSTTTTTSATTTQSTSTTTSATTTMTTTVAVTTEATSVETTAEVIETEFDLASALEAEQPEYTFSAGSLIRGNMRGTYYAPGSWNGYSNMGGSGRYLLDCNFGGDGYAKGSIASGYLYDLLGYYANGGRTAVWLEVYGYPNMSGVYYLDDCSGVDVIDFFYDQNANCQFVNAGVVSVDVYYLD